MWHLDVASGQRFDVNVLFQRATGAAGRVHLVFGGATYGVAVEKGVRSVAFEGVPVNQGRTELEAWLATGDRASGAYQVVVSLNRSHP